MKRIPYLLLVLFGSVSLLFAADDQKIKPSDAYAKYSSMMSEELKKGTVTTYAERLALMEKIAGDLLEKTDQTVSDPEEKYQLAMLLDHAQHNDEALAVTAELKSGDSLLAQKAAVMHLTLLAEMERWSSLESNLDDYYARFEAHPEISGALSGPVGSLCILHYRPNKMYDKAIETIFREIDSLEGLTPYSSYYLLVSQLPVFTDSGKLEIWKAKAKEVQEKIASIVEERNKSSQSEEPDYARATRTFSFFDTAIEASATKVNLLYSTAPDINFLEGYGDVPDRLHELKGKVVLLDFWANWCQPCKGAYPEIAKLYEQYGDDGFVPISVTSYQGSFNTDGISESNIDKDREYELTKDYVKKYEMVWPVAFMDRSEQLEKWGITSLPTFMVLDRDGKVVTFFTGSGQVSYETMKQAVTRLMEDQTAQKRQ